MSSDAFSEREKGFESKFKLDQELKFKATSRGNRKLAQWLGERFGMSEAERDAYGKDLILADMDRPGPEDLIAKVMKDIAARKAGISEHDVRRELKRCQDAALLEVINEQKAKQKK